MSYSCGTYDSCIVQNWYEGVRKIVIWFLGDKDRR